MADEVSKAFMLDTIQLDGKSVLISQQTDVSPFMHTFLAQSARQGRKICLVSMNQPASYYHSIGTRLGWNSQNSQLKDQYAFVDGLGCIAESLNDPQNESEISSTFSAEKLIHKLMTMIQQCVTKWVNCPIILCIDRLDYLFHLGASSQNVISFYQQCHCLIKENFGGKAAFVVSVEYSLRDGQLLRCSNLLSHWCDLVLLVKGLETGVSKDLMGSIFVNWSHLPTSQHFHFKSFDRGVRMFAPGLAVV